VVDPGGAVVTVRITYSEAERIIATADPVRLDTITARVADAAWMLQPSSDAAGMQARLDLADAVDELEHRERTGRWSERADASPPSCVRSAVDAIARMQREHQA
jgi:hypothetical protein